MDRHKQWPSRWIREAALERSHVSKRSVSSVQHETTADTRAAGLCMVCIVVKHLASLGTAMADCRQAWPVKL